MFKNFNTDTICIKNIFAVSIAENEVGVKKNDFGETTLYQLGIKMKGETRISYNNKILDYSANSVLYLPQEKSKYIPYNKIYKKSGYGICIFFTSPNRLSPEAKLYNNSNRETIGIFREILSLYQSGDMLETKSLFYKLLSTLDKSEICPETDSAFAAVTDYINRNIKEPYIQIAELAEIYGCSADYFRHKFKQEFGISPKKYIAREKINFIKELLLTGNANIENTAKSIGFSDSNYFTRFFKAETGLTPTEFRNKFKKFV